MLDSDLCHIYLSTLGNPILQKYKISQFGITNEKRKKQSFICGQKRFMVLLTYKENEKGLSNQKLLFLPCKNKTVNLEDQTLEVSFNE